MRPLQIVFLFFFVANVFAQRQKKVDFINAEVLITPSFQEKEIKGKVTYHLEILENVDSVFLDARHINFSKIALDDSKVQFSYDTSRVVIRKKFRQGNFHTLELEYSCKPKQTVYFLGTEDYIPYNEQIWTQGQGKYTSHWLPSLDDMNDKIEFDLEIQVAPQYSTIANGRLKKERVTGSLKSWNYDMTRPMSSYLVAFAIGNFDKKTLHSSSGVPIELYYEAKDSLKFEPTYRYTKEMFDFLEKEIGVPYPWQNYKQVPVQDFLYAGMENTGCTIFSNQYMIDSTAFVDKNYVNVNAHELAHQWFGNLVTEKSGRHHWLHEGFATYYAYLAEKELFGEDHFYWKLFETAKTLNNLSENGDGEALTNPNANSLTFYEKGAWALVILRERVGDEAFKKGIKNYLRKYAFKNVAIEDFLIEIEEVSGQTLADFREDWLYAEEFQWHEAKSYLKSKNASLNLYFDIHSQKDSSTIFDEEKLMLFFSPETPIPFKRQFLFENIERIPEPSIKKIIQSEGLKVRQAVAMSISKITESLQSEFEYMLLDESYVTKEALLFKLWTTFPERRAVYLDQTKDIIGLPNENILLLWLTLALVTPDYESEEKKKYYDEMNGYTASHYHFEVRQLAFQYLSQIQALNDESLRNLIGATDHHVWQFKKSSRNLLRELYSSKNGKSRLDPIINELDEKEQDMLIKLITQ